MMKNIRTKKFGEKAKKELSRHDIKRLLFVGVFCLIAIFQSGLRDLDNLPRGNDTPNYQYLYENIRNNSWNYLWSNFTFIGTEYTERDAGYPLFIKLTQLVSTDFTFFMFLTAILFMVPFGLLIYRYVKTYMGIVLAFLIYFALFTNIVNSFMRQAVTIGIFLFALRYMIEQNWKKYFGLIAIAITLHTSAIMTVPFYFLPKLHQKRKWVLFAFLLSPLTVYYANSLLSSVVSGTVYGNYIEAEATTPMNYILLFFAISLSAYLYYESLKKVPNWDILICGVVSSIFVMPIIFLGNTMLRISYYFVLLLIPLVPVLIDNIKMKQNMRQAIYVIFISFFLYFIFRS